jgi:hypothetical protein
LRQFVEREERSEVTVLPECLERLALHRRIDAVQTHDVLAPLGVEDWQGQFTFADLLTFSGVTQP